MVEVTRNLPRRIQRPRTKGWRMPAGAVDVGQPTKWANPILLMDVSAQYPSLSPHQVGVLVMRDFRVLAEHGALSFPNWRQFSGDRGPISWTYPSATDIGEELSGRDLVCCCPLDFPCHADVLIELANAEVPT